MSRISRIRSLSGTETNTNRSWSQVRVVLSTGRSSFGRISLRAGFLSMKPRSIASSKIAFM